MRGSEGENASDIRLAASNDIDPPEVGTKNIQAWVTMVSSKSPTKSRVVSPVNSTLFSFKPRATEVSFAGSVPR